MWNFATRITWFTMIKSSPALNIPNKTLTADKGSKLVLHYINQERRATQKDLVISQLENRCSRNSISFLQKVHCGELIILILKNFSFVKTMSRFKTLYWNSLIFVSSDTLREREYISFQSNWTSGNWSWNLFWADGGVCFAILNAL